METADRTEGTGEGDFAILRLSHNKMNPVFCYLANIIDYLRVAMLLAAFALY